MKEIITRPKERLKRTFNEQIKFKLEIMKIKNIFNYTYLTSFIVSLLFSLNSVAQEIDVDNYKMRFNLNTVKQNDNTRLLETSFIAVNKKNRKDKIPVYNAEIAFFNVLNEEEVLLGTSNTSKEGIARITLPADQEYLSNAEGYINLITRFKGTDAIDEQEEEISIKNLFIDLALTEIDSIKTVMVNAYTIDSLGVKNPVLEADVFIAVGSMISKMKIEEGSIEDGEFEYEFPTDIPGDVNGDLSIYALIEDSDDYGNVIQSETASWGVFNKEIEEKENTLWSDAAPLWMYIVLTILLIGVWANYLYSMINLLKIKKEGKQLELQSEEENT